jgi:hypothetical protein
MPSPVCLPYATARGHVGPSSPDVSPARFLISVNYCSPFILTGSTFQVDKMSLSICTHRLDAFSRFLAEVLQQ